MKSSWIKNTVLLSDRYTTNGKWVVRNRSRLLSLIVRNLDVNARKVLDLGCGDGVYSPQLLQSFPNISLLVGIDVSRESIKLAKFKYAGRKTEFILADGENLPFREKSFGAIISKDVLHHANEPMQVIKEIVRASMGASIIVEANKTNPIMLLNEKYGHHHLTSQQLIYLAKISGVSKFKTFYSYNYPFTMRLPSSNPIVSVWNLNVSFLLILSEKVPLLVDFFSQVMSPLLRQSYNGLAVNSDA